jgi:hypothetical protein
VEATCFGPYPQMGIIYSNKLQKTWDTYPAMNMVRQVTKLKIVDLGDFYRPCHLIPVPGSSKLIFNQWIDRETFEMMNHLNKKKI